MATGIQTGMGRGSRNSGLRSKAMGDKTNKNKFQQFWDGLSTKGRLGAGGLVIVFLLGLSGLYLRSASNAYVKLFPSELSGRDNHEISMALVDYKIEHELDPVDGVVLHPKDRHLALATISALNLPREPVLLYNEVNSSDLRLTAAEREAINQRLLEGDITLALRQMEAVNDATVKIAKPARVYFGDENNPVTARVNLNLRRGAKLTERQIRGVMGLVSASVPGLERENVVVVDGSSGIELTDGLSDGDDPVHASNSRFELQSRQEIRIQQKIQQALDRVLPGKTEVGINLELDFAQVEENFYNPGGVADDGVVQESYQILRERLDKHGVKSEDGESGYLNEREAGNNKVRERTEKRVDTGYRIKTITASVMADNLPDDMIDAVTEFVANGVGIDEARGDRVAVVNIPFDRKNMVALADVQPAPIVDPLAQPSGMEQFANTLLIGAGMFLGLLGFFFFRHRRGLELQGDLVGPELGGSSAAPCVDHFNEKSGRSVLTTLSDGTTQINTSDRLEQLVKERPNDVAEVLKKTWLS